MIALRSVHDTDDTAPHEDNGARLLEEFAALFVDLSRSEELASLRSSQAFQQFVARVRTILTS